MSVHTYFQKNKKSYFREKQLYDILDNTNINLCASEYQTIEDEVTKLM